MNYEKMVEAMSLNALSYADQQLDLDTQLEKVIDGGFWTVPNLKATYEALDAEGYLDVPAGSSRNLTSDERLRATRMAQAGNLDGAIGEYLRCALDGEEPDIAMTTDPAYLAVCNEAVYSVFTDTQFDYSHTGARGLLVALRRYTPTDPGIVAARLEKLPRQ